MSFVVIKKSLLEEKIVFGEPVATGTMKFMASINIQTLHVCGGCSISTMHILTVGQCIFIIYTAGGREYNETQVFLGNIELSGTGLVRSVKDLEHHDQFNPFDKFATSAFDIGIILVRLFIKKRN